MDIKELALQEAKNLLGEPLNIEQSEHYETFATRLIAAYLAEQEPVAMVVDGGGELHLPKLQWVSANHSLETPIGSNLFTAPPEPAPQQDPLHVGDSQFESWFSTYWSASLRNGSKQIARDAYAAGMGDPLVAPAACAAPSSESPCPLCANGNDLPEGEYCRSCGRTNESKLKRAVRLARGADAPPPAMSSFATARRR